jgi:hypothetical protein
MLNQDAVDLVTGNGVQCGVPLTALSEASLQNVSSFQYVLLHVLDGSWLAPACLCPHYPINIHALEPNMALVQLHIEPQLRYR